MLTFHLQEYMSTVGDGAAVNSMNRLAPLLAIALAALFVLPAGTHAASTDAGRAWTCVVVAHELDCVEGEFVPVDANGALLSHTATFYEHALYNAQDPVGGASFAVFAPTCSGWFNMPAAWNDRVSSVEVHRCAVLLFPDAGLGGTRTSCSAYTHRCEVLAVKGFDDVTSSVAYA